MHKTNRNWLEKEICSAQTSIDLWPSWMKEAAHFEGRDHHAFSSQNEVKQTPKDDKKATTTAQRKRA